MKKLSYIAVSLFLTACGGGGGGGSTNNGINVDPPSLPSPPPTVAECSIADQNQKLWSLLQDQYFWYRDLPASVSTDTYDSPSALLEAVKAPQDRYSFLLSQADYDAQFVNAFEDVIVGSRYTGYGFAYQQERSRRSLVVRYVYKDSEAEQMGLRRGDKITHVNGRPMTELIREFNAQQTTWEEHFGPAESGIATEIAWTRPDGEEITRTLIKRQVESNTVMSSQIIEHNGKRVGYLVYDKFLSRSVPELTQAMTYFSGEGVDEMILDLRYNGGGQLDVTNQLSSSLGGTTVASQVFTNLTFNDKNTHQNQSINFSPPPVGEQIALDRLFVINTKETCSASELVANSLSPYIEVVTIGNNSCGKPIGMQPVQMCDKVVFAANFQVSNSLGHGDYFDGLKPTCQTTTQAITGDWGDKSDPMVAEALHYIDNNACSGNDVEQGNVTPINMLFNIVQRARNEL